MFINSMFTLSISTITMYCNHHQHNDILASVDLVRANATWMRIARRSDIKFTVNCDVSKIEQNSLERDVKQIKKIVLRCYNE